MPDTTLLEWLALTPEDPVDPEQSIVDPHHHLWNEADALGGGGQYLVEDLVRDTRSGHNVTHTVVVESGASYRPDGRTVLRPVGETGSRRPRLSNRNRRKPGSLASWPSPT